MANLKVTTQDNETFEVQTEGYDAKAVNELINTDGIITINIGNMIFSRLDIKRVEEITEPI